MNLHNPTDDIQMELHVLPKWDENKARTPDNVDPVAIPRELASVVKDRRIRLIQRDSHVEVNISFYCWTCWLFAIIDFS